MLSRFIGITALIHSPYIDNIHAESRRNDDLRNSFKVDLKLFSSLARIFNV
jgi:hypothetical protein